MHAVNPLMCGSCSEPVMADLETFVHHHDCLIELFNVGDYSRKQ